MINTLVEPISISMSFPIIPEGHWIESGPHLMRMPKDPSSLDGMTTDFNSGEPYVMFAGTPYAHVMYPVGDYYKYQDMVKE